LKVRKSMKQKVQSAPGMNAITISRQYGSVGGEVAARLARRLQWQLVDHEIVVRVAHTLGITEEEASMHDERVEGFIARALNALQLAVPVVPIPPTTAPAQEERVYNEALQKVVVMAVKTGHVVIVGRA